MLVSQISTPALIVDMDALERNHQKLMATVRGLGLRLRPHYKSHKSTYLAHFQVENGACGVCCAKLSEAEDLILSGVEDVMVANQVTDDAKILRAAQLAGCCTLSVCVDHGENVKKLAAAAAFCGTKIGCWVEYDVGMGRCGATTEEETLALCRAVEAEPSLYLAGIQAYGGHIAHEEDAAARESHAEAIEARIRSLLDYLAESGVTVPQVGGVSTGTVVNRKAGTAYTELQAGSYLFMDAAYARVGAPFEHSLFVLAGVVSADGSHAVTDAGVKSVAVDQGAPVFVDFPDSPVEVHEEHCFVRTPNTCRPGDKLRLIPGHCCATVNLHDHIYLVRGDRVVDRIPVTSRGKSR